MTNLLRGRDNLQSFKSQNAGRIRFGDALTALWNRPDEREKYENHIQEVRRKFPIDKTFTTCRVRVSGMRVNFNPGTG